jgi:two-component system, OmpR family, phosphate regulon sensor histidine kinase PhoR
MGWLAFALTLMVLAYGSWRVWCGWIRPCRELEQIVGEMKAARTPRTFLIGGSAQVRGLALALEQLALREGALRARVQEGEFGVQAIVGALADGLVVADGERRIRLMNDAFRQMFGIDSRLTNGTLLETVRDAAVERLLGETLSRGEMGRTTITRQRQGGSEQYLEVVAEPIRDEPGAANGAVLLFRDITELRRIETMRRDFVANVSHELRTPLSILRGYLETLLENPSQPPAELLRIFEIMERHSNRLNLLVDDVLTLARLEGPGVALDLTTICPAVFLRGIMHDWERKFAAKNLQTELDVSDNLPPLRADEGRLQEVIYNLLDNAVKFSPPDGRIRVSATRDDNRISLSVSDNGAGIPTRDLPRIFERFYRADKARHRELGGTGLGLSIVKHIAQLHGGSVEAESELGRGTTVRVHLPVAVIQS